MKSIKKLYFLLNWIIHDHVIDRHVNMHAVKFKITNLKFKKLKRLTQYLT